LTRNAAIDIRTSISAQRLISGDSQLSEAEIGRRVFAEQLARTDISPQHAPRLVTRGLRDQTFSWAVHRRLSLYPRTQHTFCTPADA